VPSTIESMLEHLAAGRDLSFDEMRAAIGLVMRGLAGDDEIARLLTLLAAKGETVDEVAGAAAAMRDQMTPIRTSRTGLLDTCGTGGTGSVTFNISTTAALVVAAAGVPVAKHGNRAVTSRSGSADVLAALGVNVAAELPVVEACLDELGICFCFAPLLHPAMKQVAPIRRQLGIRTIFNLLGPLTNPAGAEYQLLGVGRGPLRPLLAAALNRLGARRAVVVSGEDGLGEVTLSGPTAVTEVAAGVLGERRWTPEDFGLPTSSLETLCVSGPEESAALVRQVLAGAAGPARDIVLVNAAAGLWTVGRGDSLRGAARRAAEAIDSGAAAKLLAELVQATRR
jgi:anthranilate phosphoribosyltransferase